jgi:hypothetical protein
LFVAVTPVLPMRFLLPPFAGGWIWLAIASPKNKSDHFGCHLTIQEC